MRAVVQTGLTANLDRAGLRFGWWEDLGAIRLFTRGVVAHRPSDLAGKQIAMSVSQTDVVFDTLRTALHSAPSTRAPFDLSDVDAAFGTPVTVAHDGFDYAYDPPLGFYSEAMVFGRRGTTDSLPAGEAFIFEQTAIRASQVLAKRLKAFTSQRVRPPMNLVTWSAAELAEWELVYFSVAQTLAQGRLDTINHVRAVRHLRPVPWP